MNRPLPNSNRRRSCPSQFSWVDHRLAREHYFGRASTKAWTLYLFLITVSDSNGASYYSERSLCIRLGLTPSQLNRARQELIELDLVSYRSPDYQVLSLPDQPPQQARTAHQARSHVDTLRRLLK